MNIANADRVQLDLPETKLNKYIPCNEVKTIVVCAFPLWKHAPNGSIKCITRFIHDCRIDDQPWVMVVLCGLFKQHNMDDPTRCNDKCISEFRNLRQTFYVDDHEDLSHMNNLLGHLKKWCAKTKNNESFSLFTFDHEASVTGGFLKTTMDQITNWTHLCTLHLTKNVHVLVERKIIAETDPVEVAGKILSGKFLKKELVALRECNQYIVVSNSEKEWVEQVLKKAIINSSSSSSPSSSSSSSSSPSSLSPPVTIYYPNAGWWIEEQKIINTMAAMGTSNPFYIREKYKDKLLILYMGRATYQKGLDMLLQIKYPSNVHLCIMSTAQFGDGNLVEKCREMEMLNYDVVSWIGPYYGRQKFEIMKQCDAVICPSTYEPFGLVGLETILFTNAILITSGVDGMKDYLVDDGYIDCGLEVGTIQNAINRFAEASSEDRAEVVQNAKTKLPQTLKI